MVWYIISPLNSYCGPLLDGASSNFRSVSCGSATTAANTKALWRCYWPCHCAAAATSILDASSGSCQLCYGSPQVGIFFRVEPPTVLYFYMLGVCSGVCFLLSGAMMGAIFTYAGSTIGICTTATHCSLPMAGICTTWWWSLANSGIHRVAASFIASHRGNLLLLNQLSPSHSNYMVGHTALEVWQRDTHSLHLPCIMGGVFFSWFISIPWHSWLNLWWALNLVILVWWLGIRLISLLTPSL